ncbi:MAG: methylated-DNA--[protein]-cysteine S-methyltransferase [Verrucomicrobia bacterium]|nr:methylated-DNA--[protein]-cysteine S-methyltransferase [Verrucomicrobiota bacterium]
MNTASFPTAFGRCAIAWNDKGLTRFNLPDSDAITDEETLPPNWVVAVMTRVQRHFDGDLQDFADVRFDFSHVTPFQERVYTAALAVKPGETHTYGWLASAIGRGPAASRAIGAALGRNPWLLLVPCHRFIGANGRLTGFSAPGGIVTKQRMLALERSELPLAVAPL